MLIKFFLKLQQYLYWEFSYKLRWQKENFDIDLSNYKIPQKSTLKISEKDNSDSAQIKTVNFENKLLPYKEKSEVLNSVKIGKNDPLRRNLK